MRGAWYYFKCEKDLLEWFQDWEVNTDHFPYLVESILKKKKNSFSSVLSTSSESSQFN